MGRRHRAACDRRIRKLMRYISTRGGMPPAAFCDILLGGLAPDGGLALPESYPQIDAATLANWRSLSYPELAFEILSLFADDIAGNDLRVLCDKTYTAQAFRTEAITPLTALEPGLHILELSNGPSAAFKDIALQLLGNLFEYVLAKRGTTLNILGATSGDTGSSAEYAMRGKAGIRVFMLSPQGRMSPFQTAQMFSLPDANIFNIAIRGVFDDCQDIVKAVSNDAGFKQQHRIGTVNSINWARVAAQVVYYFRAYFAASNGRPVSFAVPSGNFGNILAGHIAKSMGLPIHRLILATNENDVLDEFFRSGVYRVRPASAVHATSSPSMDISKASNFERFVFDMVGRDPAVVRTLWNQLATRGDFDVSATAFWQGAGKFGFVSGSSTHADRLATIRMVHSKYGRIIDPHTADGVKVGLEYRDPGIPLVCLETALPVKFADTIREALGREPEWPAEFENLEALPQRFEVMDADAEAVKNCLARHGAG
jgi:threonine synthase